VRKYIGIYVLLLSIGIILLLLGLFSEKPMQTGILTAVGIIVLGFSAAKAAPLLARKKVDEQSSKIEWRDERNTVIREKAAWYAGMILIAAMSVSAFILVLADQLAGACVIAGLLLLYSLGIMAFTAYFSKKL
jgi:heme O synthase-like polyprenyltransferase